MMYRSCGNRGEWEAINCICKECDKENRKKYYENNREKILEYQKEYYENNKGRRNKHKKEYAKNRRKEDELFAVIDRCRVRIRKFIRYSFMGCFFK